MTVVEDFDPETLIHGPTESQGYQAGNRKLRRSTISQGNPTKQLKPSKNTVNAKKSHAKVSTRAKDIRYQTKSERKTERKKQQQRKLEKASLAGGKYSRKRSQGRGKR